MASCVRFLLLICAVFSLSRLPAQGLYDNKTMGPWRLLYKLDSRQALYYARHPDRPDTQMLFTRLVGKVHNDSIIPLWRKPTDDYPVKPFTDIIRYQRCQPTFNIWDLRENGYYLQVIVYHPYRVEYRLIENPLFRIAVHRIGYETYIFAEDTAGFPVNDATVKLDTFTCRFDSSIGGYRIPGKNISGLVHVQRGDQFTIRQLNGYKDADNNRRPPRDNYDYADMRYQGYFVTDKPRYKPWDTLHYKAFIVNKYGRPVRRKLTLSVQQPGNAYQRNYRLEPESPGVYHGSIVISDSFLVDDYISLHISDKEHQTVKYLNVKVENYELRDIRFGITADKQLVTPGGGIRIYASATTTNRLPLMDGRIKMKMQLSSVNYTDADSTVIPFSKWNRWYETTVQTDPTGVTVFDIPDSIFIPLDGSFLVTCELLTSDNEKRESSLSFRYQTTRDRQEAGMDADTLFVNRLYNMKSVKRKMRIKLYSQHNLLADSAFYTPFRQYLPPNVHRAEVYRSDTLCGTFYRTVRLPEISGNRTHDSIHIRFVSQPDIPVFYRIYANNRVVQSGKTTALNFHIADRSKNSYHLQYGVLEGSVLQPRFYSRSFHFAEKSISIQTNHPEIIYPGQEVAVTVTVKNAKGKPLKKVNLTAWAVNEQMEGIVTPDVPYLGLVKPQKPLPTKEWGTSAVNSINSTEIKRWQVPAFRLRDNAMYRVLFPVSGFEVLTDTTPLHTTEIDFFSAHQAIRENIVWVKRNDTLLITRDGTAWPRTRRITPGTCSFTVRTWDHVYHLDNVLITEGKKNFICLNTDTLDLLRRGDTALAGMLSEEEIRMMYGHTLLYRFGSALSDTLIFRVNGKLRQAFGPYQQHSSTMIRLQRHLFNPGRNNRYSEYQDFRLFGPLDSGDAVEIGWKNGYSHAFTFVPGVSYSFTPSEMVTEEARDWTENIRLFDRISHEQFAFNSFWFDPFAPKPKTKAPENPVYVQPPHYAPQLEEFVYRDYYPGMLNGRTDTLSGSSLHLYLPVNWNAKKVWLFYTRDSVYSSLSNSAWFYQEFPDVGLRGRQFGLSMPKTGANRYLLLMQLNDSIWAVKKLRIDTSSALFLTLRENSFRKLSQREYLLFDRLAKNLAREPLTAFSDTPTVNTGMLMIPMKHPTGGTSLEGIVIGPNLKYPVNNAFVILERNGIYVAGAISNREGRFLISKLQPGSYMLKIKGQNYHYWIHYRIDIVQGFNHYLQASMKPYAGQSYTGMYTTWSSGNSPDTDADGVGTLMDVEGRAITRNYATADKMYAAPAALEKNYTVLAASAIRGSREDGNAYYVDGVRITGNEKKEYKKQREFMVMADSIGWTEEDQNRESDRLDEMSKTDDARRIRRDFRDLAYWIPNLYTNKKGQAGYTVRYPDNVTTWKTFIPAMDGKRHSGLAELSIRSYKPVVSSVALPAFLTEGDVFTARGRTMNYTGKPLNGHFRFIVDNFRRESDILINDYYNDTFRINAGKSGDTIHTEIAFELPNGYRDGVARTIPVIPATVISGRSSFAAVEADTSMLFRPDSNDFEMEVAVYNHEAVMLLRMVESVIDLPVYDNRSLAGRLNALLISKALCSRLEIPFTREKLLRETMSSIKKNQRNNGWFGWLPGSKNNYAVSAAVAEIMYKAHQAGYENNTWLNVARQMEKTIGQVGGHERLRYLLCLKRMNRDMPWDSLLKGYNSRNMNRSMLLDYIRIRQMNGQKAGLSQLAPMLQRSAEGNLYVSGDWIWDIAMITDDAANTMKAWEILYSDGSAKFQRKALLNYLSNECVTPSYARADAVEALWLESAASGTADKSKSTVTVNGTLLTPDKMPLVVRLKAGDSLRIGHSGAPVYIAANRKFRTYDPVSDARQFGISTALKNGSDRMQAGDPVQMKVKVVAKRNQFNAIVEVPIPAGCVWGPKIQSENFAETHREYLNDRVLIFCDELPFGDHEFTLNLVPKFNGVFHTAPARAALMFYPDKAAYTAKKKFTISD